MLARITFTSVLFLLSSPIALAAETIDDAPITLVLENHHFTPSTFTVPADKRFRIQLTSHDNSVDEFESYDMKFEKIIVPGGTITVFTGPMHPGTYSFFDDYHPDDAKGTVTVTATGGQDDAR
ncbi:cupredoxin domain-containing protein [Pseudomonas gingeri]|uniref:cupredoxin domain-containing protein n=1 Tax=Pseudomonas gingeri TaxID=117681 RepID=UPI0015A34CD5|nr:cupredoxin domain-containing protein [Pseudomonas gingeri]NWA03286.1 cupredoxin domain-containing protein [Pseudomonas gingeri]NWA14143.1 cupredoxin domain-containing protein [Pseudomonas gingeri]NWA55239.1 cupredoxin domain-containing protein [Pseudomonas gingeri]NWA94963.1 cupredoxin domain-containing protein [Pseudomonas gingeri]NWB01619.1 cupredoxin domain-containing protein [Pseudomonas gingeri]